MAVNLPQHGTWDPITSNRAPIVGDISTQYDIMRDTHRTAVYDGHRWVEMHNNTITSGNIGATTIASTSSGKISSVEDVFLQERMYEFMRENIRVAEYTDDAGKIHTVQLEMRMGPSYVWEPIKRVKTKNPL